MATRNIVPRATGEGSLGTETKKWGNIYADNLHSSNPLPIANGGTGASTAEQARTNLGIKDIATYDVLPIANGGTGASTAEQARTNLGIKDITTYDVLPIANGGTGANNASDALKNLGVLDLIYPVGSLYWSKKSTNPATLFGGIWTQIKDKFILACGDTYGVGTTGGSATVTLTTAQLPAHNHSASSNNISATGKFMLGGTEICQEATGVFFSNGKGGSYSAGHSGGAENPRIGFSNTHSHTVTINNTGSGQAHENMPPYVTYYCWERTA